MPNHVFGDGRLADVKAELEQLTMNARSTPDRVASAHRSDQSAKFFWNARPAQLAAADFPPPEETETLPMPGDDRLWLHDHKD